MEKTKERKIPLQFNFIDFKLVFDTIWRNALWKMLRTIGVNTKIIDIIEYMYQKTECAVLINNSLTECFKVMIGVRQGCIISPTLSNIFLDFVMAELKSLRDELHLDEKLSTDCRYADDTTVTTAIFEKLKLSTHELEKACSK